MQDFIFLLQQQSIGWQVFIGSILIVVCAIFMGGLLAIVELAIRERK